MTLKEIKEKLEIKNDINNLSVEQLREKYKKTPEDYERVASIFADMFTKRGSLYSLCVEKKYEKIKEFFKDEDKENNRRILKRMYDEMQAPNFSKNADQAEAVYCQGLGADALIEGRNFSEIIDMVLKGVKQIEKSNFKNTKGYNETYLAYIREIGSALEKGETDEANKLISELENVHPGLLLCNNVNFLLATNYLLQIPEYEDEERLICLARGVIDEPKSNLYFAINYGKDAVKKENEYKKLARYTARNINRIERKKRQAEMQNPKETVGKKLKKVFQRKQNIEEK